MTLHVSTSSKIKLFAQGERGVARPARARTGESAAQVGGAQLWPHGQSVLHRGHPRLQQHAPRHRLLPLPHSADSTPTPAPQDTSVATP